MTQVLTDRATLEQMVDALENSIDDVRTYLADAEQLAGYPRYDRRIAAYKAQVGAHEAAITAGRAALANAEPTGWIAAKDRMPPPQVRVLGFEPQYNIVDVDMWFGPDFNWGYSYWMPLPAAPKDTL